MSGVGREADDNEYSEYVPEFKFQKLINFMKSVGEVSLLYCYFLEI